MARMLDTIKKPYVWIFASVVYIWLLGLVKLFATLGPAYVISRIAHTENSFWVSDIGKGFQSYAQEVAKRLGCRYEYVLYNFLANIFIFVPAIILGFFVLRKKLWALNTITIFILAYIIQTGVFSLLFSGSLEGIVGVNYVILIGIMGLFTKKQLKPYSNKDGLFVPLSPTLPSFFP